MGAPVQLGDVLLGKYTVERVLGTGGMGMVVAARHRDLDELFAIKVLLPQALDDREAVERFKREGRAAAKLKGEHVARVHDVGVLASGLPCMVMEYLEGRDLGEVLKVRGPLSVRDAASYVIQVCEAIAEAHALQLIHRDLKPANLFLAWRRGAKPCIKVLDFGISKWRAKGERSLTQDGSFVGSPFYMSPEQMLRRKELDGRSDIWSLGVVLYQLVTGAVPFGGETMAEVVEGVVRGKLVPPSQRRSGIPASFDAVVDRCLQKVAGGRFQTAEALAEALEGVLRDEAAHAAPRQFSSGMTPLPGMATARQGAAGQATAGQATAGQGAAGQGAAGQATAGNAELMKGWRDAFGSEATLKKAGILARKTVPLPS